MNELFNTPFETGLRAMLILYSTNSYGMTIDRIVAYDFMTIYGGDLGISNINLHGINHFNFSELASKRAICSEGLKMFVLEGLITVTRNKNGFLYSITLAGKKYVEELKSNYKNQYLDILKGVQSKYETVADSELIKYISNTAIRALRRET